MRSSPLRRARRIRRTRHALSSASAFRQQTIAIVRDRRHSCPHARHSARRRSRRPPERRRSVPAPASHGHLQRAHSRGHGEVNATASGHNASNKARHPFPRPPRSRKPAARVLLDRREATRSSRSAGEARRSCRSVSWTCCHRRRDPRARSGSKRTVDGLVLNEVIDEGRELKAAAGPRRGRCARRRAR